MNKKILLLLLTSCYISAIAQPSSNKGKSNIIIGNSLTYMPLEQYQDPIWLHWITDHEYSWTLTLGLELHPIYRTNLQNTFFAFAIADQPIGTANITGITHQINPAYMTNFRIYGEIGTHIGRYCSCSPELRRMDYTRFYLSLGMGGNIWLTPKLDLKLSVANYFMVNAPSDHRGHFRYFIGLDYYFRKRQKVRYD